jgi:hypothetical protein
MVLERSLRDEVQVIKANICRRQVRGRRRPVCFKHAVSSPCQGTEGPQYRQTNEATVSRLHIHKGLLLIARNKKCHIAQLNASQRQALGHGHAERQPVAAYVL